MSVEVPQFIFAREGERWIPQPLAAGPWYPGTVHGSVMLGLLARAIEGMPDAEGFQVTRFTVDMMRAAPMEALETPTAVLHAGRMSQFVEARIESGGRVFARATALRLLENEIDTSSEQSDYGRGSAMPAPNVDFSGSFIPETDEPMPPAFHQAFDIQPSSDAERTAVWFRMKLPFIEGESVSPFLRASLTADWTYSIPFISKVMRNGGIPPAREFSAINPDTSLNLHRSLRGEWVGLDGLIHYGATGSGSALAFVHDLDGPVGHSSQAILLRGPDKLAKSVAARRIQALHESGQL